MDRNLEEMRKLVEASKYDGTLGGQALKIAGTLFALYCTYRTVIVSPFSLHFRPTVA